MIKYNRTSFYPIKKKVFTSDIKKLFLNYIIKSNINDNFELKDLSSLNNLRDNSFLILSNSIDIDISNKKVLIITSDNSIYEKFSDYNTLLTNDIVPFIVNNIGKKKKTLRNFNSILKYITLIKHNYENTL
tara:strand:+ start:1312 stop:1704 length:393 start_codon:yes stop_codon:yes gene_type:complete